MSVSLMPIPMQTTSPPFLHYNGNVNRNSVASFGSFSSTGSIPPVQLFPRIQNASTPLHHRGSSASVVSSPAIAGPSFSTPQNGPPAHSHPPIPEHNEVLLTRTSLLSILAYLSSQVLRVFGQRVRLIVHGGAVMLLHPSLSLSSRRTSTRDVDFIARAFISEWATMGVYDARERLVWCIRATAKKFGLGKDWMNAAADVALPMATDPSTGRQYDPLYQASIKENNVLLNTIYNSAGLTLIAVAPYWAVALKLVRYAKDDPADISAMLQHGTNLNGVRWSPAVLEGWLLTECWPMGYSNYPPDEREKMREKIRHAVHQAYGHQTAPPHLQVGGWVQRGQQAM